jgi:hypothetical protein
MMRILFAIALFLPIIGYAIELPIPASTPVAPAPLDVQIQGRSNSKMISGGSADSGAPKVIRKKELNFEGRGVEVLLGKDYESLSQTGTVEPANREKLYKTRLFMNESENLLQELEYSR